jgi:hypothetical protein
MSSRCARANRLRALILSTSIKLSSEILGPYPCLPRTSAMPQPRIRLEVVTNRTPQSDKALASRCIWDRTRAPIFAEEKLEQTSCPCRTEIFTESLVFLSLLLQNNTKESMLHEHAWPSTSNHLARRLVLAVRRGSDESEVPVWSKNGYTAHGMPDVAT